MTIVFKNKLNSEDVIKFEDESDNPTLYQEIWKKSELNPDIADEQIEWLVGVEQDFKVHQEINLDLKSKEIFDLKSKLESTDYQAIKFAEGELTAAEYEPTKQQRRQWRQRINELGG